MELDHRVRRFLFWPKKSLTTECLRRYTNPKRPFELHTDASDYAIGAVLVQRNDEGIEQPLEYLSKYLSPRFTSTLLVSPSTCLLITIPRVHAHDEGPYPAHYTLAHNLGRIPLHSGLPE
eukprot:gene5530-11139_t